MVSRKKLLKRKRGGEYGRISPGRNDKVKRENETLRISKDNVYFLQMFLFQVTHVLTALYISDTLTSTQMLLFPGE